MPAVFVESGFVCTYISYKGCRTLCVYCRPPARIFGVPWMLEAEQHGGGDPPASLQVISRPHGTAGFIHRFQPLQHDCCGGFFIGKVFKIIVDFAPACVLQYEKL